MNQRKPYLVCKNADALATTSIPPPPVTDMPDEVTRFLRRVGNNKPLQQELVSFLRRSPVFSKRYMRLQGYGINQPLRPTEIDALAKFLAQPQDRQVGLEDMKQTVRELGYMLTSYEAMKYLRKHMYAMQTSITISDFIEYLIQGL